MDRYGRKVWQNMNGLLNIVRNLTAFGWVSQRKFSVSFGIGLWICAVLLYGLGDLVTTNLVLTSGGRELNPLFAATVHAFGGDFCGSTIAKVFIIGCLIAVYLFGSVKYRWTIPSLLSLAGAGLMANNLISYLHS